MAIQLVPAPEVQSHLLGPVGYLPGNPRLPLLHYRQFFSGAGEVVADALEAHLARHHWGDAWRWGIYDFHHYHSRAHEVLACYQGWARVQFGGPDGPILDLRPGDAVAIPAGVAHCLRESGDGFQVLGAYPDGQHVDLKLDAEEDLEEAQRHLPLVPLPTADPYYGVHGPLLQFWQRHPPHGPSS